MIAVLAGRGTQRRLSELAVVADLDPATGDYRVLPSETTSDLIPNGDYE
jgi:type IV secretion system protein VirB11